MIGNSKCQMVTKYVRIEYSKTHCLWTLVNVKTLQAWSYLAQPRTEYTCKTSGCERRLKNFAWTQRFDSGCNHIVTVAYRGEAQSNPLAPFTVCNGLASVVEAGTPVKPSNLHHHLLPGSSSEVSRV